MFTIIFTIVCLITATGGGIFYSLKFHDGYGDGSAVGVALSEN